jgi:anti-sigma B factor antagonist
MNAAKQNVTAAAKLCIVGDMTIYQALELKQTVIAKLAQSPILEIDLSGVTDFDSAGVQILLMAKREACARAGELRLVGHSPAVLDVFGLFDLGAHFSNEPAKSSRLS